MATSRPPELARSRPRETEASVGARIHDDPIAHGFARSLRADAVTLGADIYFASGRYAPGTASGRQLLRHELAHVAQTGPGEESGAPPSRFEVAAPDHPAELEARRLAEGSGPIQRRGARQASWAAMAFRQPATDEVAEEPEEAVQPAGPIDPATAETKPPPSPYIIGEYHEPERLPADRLDHMGSRRAERIQRNRRVRAAFMDAFGVGSKLSDAEVAFLERFLPDSLDLSSIRIRKMSAERAVRIQKRRGLAGPPLGRVHKNTVWIHEKLFDGDKLDLGRDNAEVEATLAHEAFHVLQETSGRGKGHERRYAKRHDIPHSGGGRYEYTDRPDASQQLWEFRRSEFEQQARMFEHGVQRTLVEESGVNLIPPGDAGDYDLILDYVEGLE